MALDTYPRHAGVTYRCRDRGGSRTYVVEVRVPPAEGRVMHRWREIATAWPEGRRWSWCPEWELTSHSRQSRRSCAQRAIEVWLERLAEPAAVERDAPVVVEALPFDPKAPFAVGARVFYLPFMDRRKSFPVVRCMRRSNGWRVFIDVGYGIVAGRPAKFKEVSGA